MSRRILALAILAVLTMETKYYLQNDFEDRILNFTTREIAPIEKRNKRL